MSPFTPVTTLIGRVFSPQPLPPPSPQRTMQAQQQLQRALDEYLEGAFTAQPLLRMLNNVGVPEWGDPDPFWIEVDAREFACRRERKQEILAFVRQANATLPVYLPRVREEIGRACDKTAKHPAGAIRLYDIAKRLNPYTPTALDAEFGKLSAPVKNAMLTSPDWVAEESREVGRRIRARVSLIREQVRQTGIGGLEHPWQWVELAAYLNMLRWRPSAPASDVFRAELEDLQKWVRVPEYMINGTFDYVPGKK